MQLAVPVARAIGMALALAATGLAAPPVMASVPSLVPAPAQVEPGEGSFSLDPHTPVHVVSGQAEALRIAQYFSDHLARTRGLRLQVDQATKPARAIVFAVDPASAANDEEAYSLEVTPKGIRLSARHAHGLFNGAMSLLQLAGTGDAPIRIPAQRIEDRPRFSWRGLMLDSARHMQTPEEIKQFIDAMALHKLNVLQWHLTDDQGWRLQIDKYPRLTEVGAWRVPAGAAGVDERSGKPARYGGFYSKAQVRDIVQYAAERYITIVPEIDMPGHAQAAIAAYPELGTVPAPRVSPDWGVHEYLFNNEETTFTFLEDVLTEVMALFPGRYIHIGGDEAVKTQWKASARVQERMRELGVADEVAMQAWLTARMQRFLAAHGRRLIGWDEILEGELPADAVVMSWRGVEGAQTATAKGHDSVLSPWPTLYFDNRQGTGADEPPGRLRVVSLEDVYRFDPQPPGMSAEQARHLLGVQGNIWTEHIRTMARVQWMSFPRAAAIAEMGWSPAARRDWADFRRRLPALYALYDALGILHADRLYTDESPLAASPPGPRRSSAQLKLCSDGISLALEDDAPALGPRAIFHLDIQNPCWIYQQADLDAATSLVAAVGGVPFNFQIGDAAAKIHFPTPATSEGELLVYLDRCEGELLARLPLAPASASSAVTVLPAAALPRRAGRHDLCLRFAQRGLDPMHTIDWVEVAAAPASAGGK